MRNFLKRKRKPGKGKKTRGPLRRISRYCAIGAVLLWLLLSCTGGWFVSHSKQWIAQQCEAWPHFITAPLCYCGDRAILVTDGLGWTGHDAIYDPDQSPPTGSVLYAGAPQRVRAPAPADVRTYTRGPFIIGHSASLGHPVWVAYHIPAKAACEAEKRPHFYHDRSVVGCARPGDYRHSGYDRGHLAPNHAIATRFGSNAQRLTFAMSNVVPQKPALNRGPWRFLERIAADLWTRAYGELWVIAGTVSYGTGTLPGTTVDVPDAFWQVMLAQTKDGLRLLAFYLPRDAGYGDYPVHDIVTLDELERLTGFTFFPEMPAFLKRPLLTDRPTRLWPVKWYDIFRLLMLKAERG